MARRTAPTNGEIVVYGLAVLGGGQQLVHTEEVAAKCAELSPERFGWKMPAYRRRKWADKEAVKRALRAARKLDRVDGAYASSLAKDGWVLSATGLSWLRENAQRIEQHLGVKASLKFARALDRMRLRQRLENDPLFRLFMDSGSLEDASPEDLARLLDVSLRWPPPKIVARFDRLELEATLARDADVITFLKACRKSFAGLQQSHKA